jgi:hypothetical protein
VHGRDHHPVDVPADEAFDARLAGGGGGQCQHELFLGPLEFLGDALDEAGEEQVVGEDPAGRLGHDEREEVGPLRHQAAGGRIGNVSQFGHGAPYGLLDLGGDPVRTVHDARCGGPRDACPRGHPFQRWPFP